MTTALIFPGQGSQFIGMGKELFDTFSESKEVFQEVDDTLNFNLSKLIFTGEIEELTQTQNAQPAIMAVSIAALRALEKQSGKKAKDLCDYVCGHSLGEYSAHVAAETFSLRDATKILKVRSATMNEVANKMYSGMLALMGAGIEEAEDLVAAAAEHGICEIANDNGAGQIVISGSIEAINWAENAAIDFGFRRAIKLKVSGAFHSSLMQQASIKVRAAMREVHISQPKIKLIANYNLKLVNEESDIIESLVEQIVSRVRWRETIEYLNSHSVDKYLEIGPGSVLSGICKRMCPNAVSTSISEPDDIESFLSQL
ncbi:MAG: putative transporter ATP-binding protein [Candidatus Midichloriaceae bacterium]|nr:putative transporter ATP-binding protein [Candidatus Midichloriaceae bacterium]